MNCPQCGTYFGNSQRFCTGCGRDIFGETPAATIGAYNPHGDWGVHNDLPAPDLLIDSEGRLLGTSYGRPEGKPRSGAGSAGAGIIGLLALVAKLKSVLLLFKFGKFGMTFVTMLVSVWLYAQFFGLSFAIGFVLLLLVHELGHWVVLRAKGVAATAPVFIPFLGAAIGMRGRPRNVKDEAEIGIAGPIAGTAAALLVGIAGTLLPAGRGQSLCYALGYVGLLLNLFNLIPVSPLDGGRIAAAISRWVWPIGLAILLALFLNRPTAILLLILVLGGFETIGRFIRRDRVQRESGYYSIAPAARLTLAVVFFGLLAVTAGGMELFHDQLQNIN